MSLSKIKVLDKRQPTSRKRGTLPSLKKGKTRVDKENSLSRNLTLTRNSSVYDDNSYQDKYRGNMKPEELSQERKRYLGSIEHHKNDQFIKYMMIKYD